jgi:hypothetical protein
VVNDPADGEAEGYLRTAREHAHNDDDALVSLEAAYHLATNLVAKAASFVVVHDSDDEEPVDNRWERAFSQPAPVDGAQVEEALDLLEFVVDEGQRKGGEEFIELARRARRSLAVDLLALGRKRDAKRTLREGIKRGDALAALSLAELMLEQGDEREAQRWWRHVLKTEPGSALAQEAAFRCAHLLLDRHKDARPLLVQAARGPDQQIAHTAQVLLDQWSARAGWS